MADIDDEIAMGIETSRRECEIRKINSKNEAIGCGARNAQSDKVQIEAGSLRGRLKSNYARRRTIKWEAAMRMSASLLAGWYS